MSPSPPTVPGADGPSSASAPSRLRPFGPALLDERVRVTPPDGYRVARLLEVRFSDTDMMGHVNNVAYVAFLETLRFHYLAHMDFPDDLTLVSVRVDFRFPARFGDRLVGATRTTRLGNSSIDLQHVVLEAGGGRIVAEGQSTVVAVDPGSGSSRPLSPALRDAVQSLDGPLS